MRQILWAHLQLRWRESWLRRGKRLRGEELCLVENHRKNLRQLIKNLVSRSETHTLALNEIQLVEETSEMTREILNRAPAPPGWAPGLLCFLFVANLLSYQPWTSWLKHWSPRIGQYPLSEIHQPLAHRFGELGESDSNPLRDVIPRNLPHKLQRLGVPRQTELQID